MTMAGFFARYICSLFLFQNHGALAVVHSVLWSIVYYFCLPGLQDKVKDRKTYLEVLSTANVDVGCYEELNSF